MTDNQIDQDQITKAQKDGAAPPFQPFTHMCLAGRYSLQGLKVLFTQETSSKIELILLVLSSILFLGTGRSWGEWLILLILFLLLLAVEALNSAIENIVDHLSPDYSEFAKDTKDLGSAAVLCICVAIMAYCMYVFWPLVLAIVSNLLQATTA